MICGVSADRKSAAILRKRGDEVELGTVQPLTPGKPISGEVVRLKPRAKAPMVCDVEVQYDGRPARARSGPAQVSTQAYREGWEAIYARPASGKDALLN